MRPVNLIPNEERPGSKRPTRSGPIAYILVAALVLLLLGVTAVVVTSNKISDSKAEISSLESEVTSAEARAEALSAYTQFHSVREQRVATVTSLADSRFDWERVMRELALILPGNVWLTNLTATASPAVAPDGGTSVGLRASVAGPALSLIGCGSSQEAVAGFVRALKDIDGVTRVGVQSSVLGSGGSAEGDSATGSSTCQTKEFIAQFQMVVAFDAAPVPTEASATPGAPEATAPAPESSEASTSTESEGEG
jgi:Tfp pilus assembly protein PilN